MMKVRTSRSRRRTNEKATSSHRHSKKECVKLLGHLSAYLDGELKETLCAKIRRHADLCRKCELFISSLRQTVSLCRHARAATLTPAAKTRLRRAILKALLPSRPR